MHLLRGRVLPNWHRRLRFGLPGHFCQLVRHSPCIRTAAPRTSDASLHVARTSHSPATPAPRPQPPRTLAPRLSPRRSITARSSWSELEQHGFAATFELPKLLATLFIIFAGVRRTDVYLRRDFAARELMLMVIEQQAREMEDALKAAAEMGREMDSATLSISTSSTSTATG